MKKLTALLLVLLMMAPLAACAQAADYVTDTKNIITQLFAGEAEAVYKRLTPTMQQAVPLETLKTLPAALAGECGSFVSFGEPQTADTTVAMRLNMERRHLLAQFTFDEHGLVSLFSIIFDPNQELEYPLADNEEAAEVGKYKLPGALTLPEGDKLPAVVLVHGSGPNDRNETLGNTGVFRDLAEGLAAQGIAVLRYDKRTFRMKMGNIPFTTEDILSMTFYDETIEDAVAAVAMLKADPRIDPERVYIIGHSLGAMLATEINLEADAAGLVLLAGTPRPLVDVLIDQLSVPGAEAYASELAVAKTIKDMTEAESKAATVMGGGAYSFWDDAQHDRFALAKECAVPMLILQGSEDPQVYPDKDYPLWEQIAAENPDKDMTLKLYQGLGHMFLDGGNMSAEVIDDIAAWILAR